MSNAVRTALVTALGGVVFALAPGVAAGAVPFSSWYWSLAVPSSSPNVVLLGTSKGVFRSTDGGKSWAASGLAGVDTTSLVQVGSAILAGGARVSANAKPVSVKNGVYSVAPGPAVLAESTDAGASWSDLHPKGLPDIGVQAIAVDPSNDKTIDVVLRNGALYGSTDGAQTFTRLASKVGGTPWALAITQAGRLVSGNMTTGNYVGLADQWQHTAFVDPRGTKMVMEYAVQPTSLEHVLMTSYGIVASNNGGKSWHVVLKSKVMFGPVTFSGSSPDVAYAVGFDQSFWRSSNGGVTWTKVS
jgi:photosystem II stability/assembly factor-like uncharacterized protein